MARLTRSEITAIATTAGLGLTATTLIVYLASTAPHGRPARAVADHAVRTGARPHRHDLTLPFTFDLTAVAAVGCALAVLALWGWWQTHNRCRSCGYCPAWCHCDELAERQH